MLSPEQERTERIVGNAATDTERMPTKFDLRKLLHFVKVVEQGSMQKAARLLSVSQPAISTSMRRLEESLGFSLLYRNSRGVETTPMGELFFSHAKLICDEIDLAHQRLKGEVRTDTSTVTIGVLPSLASSVVAPAAGQWQSDRPSSQLRIIERVQAELLIGLRRGDFDFFIGTTENYKYVDGMRQRVLFRDRQCVFARTLHPVFSIQEITWPALAQFRWVYPMVGRQRTLLEDLISEAGLEMPSTIVEGGSVQFVKSLVLNSDYLAILPLHTIKSDIDSARLAPVAIDNVKFGRDIALFYREGELLSEHAREFIAHVEAIGQRIACET